MNLEGNGENGTGTLMGVGVYATRDAFMIYSVLGQVDLRWSLRQRRKILCAQVSLQRRVRRRRCSDAAEQNSKTCFAEIGGRVWIGEWGRGRYSDLSQSFNHSCLLCGGSSTPYNARNGSVRWEVFLRNGSILVCGHTYPET